MHYKLCLVGFGNVGRALARLLVRKEAVLEKDHGITFSFTGIATGRHGFAADPDGLDIQTALALFESGRSISPLSGAGIHARDTLSVIRESRADVLFENSPVNHETGQPGIEHLRSALEAGMHAITANKGTVVHGYRSLTELANSRGRKFYFEATVLGGSPVFSVFRECMPGADLQSFRGVLNSTTNIILTRMEKGETFDQAVKFCQDIGVAETDPSADVDGWDAAIKVAALVSVLMDQPFTPQEVQRQGIRGITPDMITAAKAAGQRYKLVCSAKRAGPHIKATVLPELVCISDPLYGMEDSTTGVAFRTDVLGDYSIVESERPDMVAGPEPTAYGLFADFVNAVQGER
ncbi:MAG TPA: homoserine dehydrogenase [Anaerolineales bacterium]|nr:homoserine dehydrogenase [Anaerolineales bacterium]